MNRFLEFTLDAATWCEQRLSALTNRGTHRVRDDIDDSDFIMRTLIEDYDRTVRSGQPRASTRLAPPVEARSFPNP